MIRLVDQVSSDGTSTQIGVADSDLYNLNQAQLVQQLSEIKSLGVTDVRIAIPWVYIQPTSTSYDWSTMDNIVKTASSMGLQITGDITENPSWDGTILAGAPNPTAYANFAAAVAQRYAGAIDSLEVWNEPNGLPFFAPVSPAAYTAVLKAAYTAIKAVNPSVTVIAGALGAAGNFPGLSMTASSFLAGMYAAGAAGFFDALSYHPYGNGLPFSAGADVNNSALQQVAALYALMVANGDAAKKIWATEFGAPTTPGTGATQTEQAQLLEDFVSAWSRLSFAGPAFYYSAQDIQTGVLGDEGNYGLFTSAGIAKAAAKMLATLISDINAGTVPTYTAPLLSTAQMAFQQLIGAGLFIANAVLLLPNALINGMLSSAPAPIKKAFSVLSNAVVAVTAQAVSAIAPVATAAIGIALSAGPTIQKAASALASAGKAVAVAVGAALAGTRATLAAAAHNAEVTIAAAINPQHKHPAPTTATPLAVTLTAATAPATIASLPTATAPVASTLDPATAHAKKTRTATSSTSTAESTSASNAASRDDPATRTDVKPHSAAKHAATHGRDTGSTQHAAATGHRTPKHATGGHPASSANNGRHGK